MPDPNPIGIFDSGVGGLSVMQIIRCKLSPENIIYFADSAYCPYGERPPEKVRQRAIHLCNFLIKQGAKIVVVACNTASSAVLNELREIYKIPIIGMEPALKPAAAITCNGKIGILATGLTINGERFNSLVQRFGKDINVVTQPCPGLVELIENGETNSTKVRSMLETYLQPLIKEEVDTLVLGCTHYPFLRSLIQSILDPGIKIIDTGEPVAKRVSQILNENSLNAPEKKAPGNIKIYTTGKPEKVEKVVKSLLELDNLQVNHVTI
ncbi:MAG: glutamate racemase [Clostridiales bacterium]|nr:glutamate racemase [Clostridiales bacterium]MCF8022292.1 glutamate racemase [Clostridiales bacterium]